MTLPLTKTVAYELVQVHAPIFLRRQVLVKEAEAGSMVPSGMVSEMNSALSQTWVAEGTVVLVGAVVIVGTGVSVAVAVPIEGVADNWAATVCAAAV
jgi:hypothetical protein